MPGTKVTLTTERYLEIPEFAVLIQNAVKEIGLEIELNILDQGAYYGEAVFGKSNWLNSVMGITDYGHRGVPNVFLPAPLTSDGTWNAAHFKNPEYDQLAKSYIAALDLESQRATAGQIQRLLLAGDAAVVRLFLRLPDRDAQGRDRRRADRDGPGLPRRRVRGPVTLQPGPNAEAAA